MQLFALVEQLEKDDRLAQLEWKGINLWVLFRLELLAKVIKGEDASRFESMVLSRRLGWRERLSLRRKERALGKKLANQLAQVPFTDSLLLFTEQDAHYSDYGKGPFNRHLDPYYAAARAAGISAGKVHVWVSDTWKGADLGHTLFPEPATVNDFLWLGQKLASQDAPDAAWEIGELLDVNVGKVMAQSAHIRQLMELYVPWVGKQSFEAMGVVNYHNVHAMALIEACRMHGKPSFDIQHGKQGALNFSYSSFAYPLPRPGSLLPDGHWNWNVESARSIRAGGEFFRCAIGGNAWINCNREEAIASPHPEEQKFLDRVKSAAFSVLFCAQPQSDYVIPDYLFAVAEKHPEVEFGIRLHPRQNANAIPELAELAALPNVNVTEATSVFLFAALRTFSAVATRWSTVALEARLFGKRAWICDSFGLKTFENLVAEGHMTAALTGKDWEEAMAASPPPEFPTSYAPERTSDQLKACFEFLMAPIGVARIFDPEDA